jgi:electron transfer flavoprotein alpha subunit
MSVLAYTESENGSFKKSAFEVASYASKLAESLGTEAVAVALIRVSSEPMGSKRCFRSQKTG